MRFAKFIMRHRLLTLLFILGSTSYLLSEMLGVRVRTSFDELLPHKHPYIKLHKDVRDKFAGANVVTMSLEAKEGSIFNPITLEKIRYITDQLDLIPGINHYQVESIAHIKIRTIRTTIEGMVRGEPLLPLEIPTSKEELEQIRRDCYINDTVYGRLVSYDGKAALISGAFHEHMLNYPVIFQRLRQIKRDVEDENHILYITGPPMLYGWIYYHYIYNRGFFWGLSSLTVLGITLLVLFSLLILYFRRLVGVIVPMTGAFVSAIWGIGFAGIVGYDFDPLILIVHLLVTARCISHSVQMTERFLEAYETTGDKKASATIAMADLFIPGSISVVTDAMGIYVVSVASIPIMHRLAFFNTFWGMSIILSVLILTPIMISYLPAPRKRERHIVKPVERYLHFMGNLSTGTKSRYVITGVAIVIFAFTFWHSRYITIGDTRPGSPLLWPEHSYNVSSRAINEKFSGTNHLYIIFSGDKDDSIKEPLVLSTMDRFGRYLRQSPSAGGDFSIATMARSINKMFHYEDPVWGMIPGTAAQAGGFFFQYEVGSPIPRVLSSYMDPHAREANLAIYYKDTKRETIDDAIRRTEEFAGAHPLKFERVMEGKKEKVEVNYNIAAGLIGILDATNEEIEWSSLWNDILVFSMVFFCVFVSYLSPIASLLIIAPLGLATLMARSYMVFANIGMNINTLPVAAIGVGVGVDYAVYIIDRMKREYVACGRDLDAAIRKAISTTGMAVTFTAAALVGGIVFWYPLSPIRFQCEMALLLALILTANAVFAITLVPSLFSLIKPGYALEEAKKGLGQRMLIAAGFCLLLMGTISFFAYLTGHRNMDAEFFTIMGGLTIVQVIFGVGIQAVET